MNQSTLKTYKATCFLQRCMRLGTTGKTALRALRSELNHLIDLQVRGTHHERSPLRKSARFSRTSICNNAPTDPDTEASDLECSHFPHPSSVQWGLCLERICFDPVNSGEYGQGDVRVQSAELEGFYHEEIEGARSSGTMRRVLSEQMIAFTSFNWPSIRYGYSALRARLQWQLSRLGGRKLVTGRAPIMSPVALFQAPRSGARRPSSLSVANGSGKMKTSGYNIMRDDSALLEEFEKSPPSFTVQLYPGHWTMNNGPKFMYNNQVSVRARYSCFLRLSNYLLSVYPRGYQGL